MDTFKDRTRIFWLCFASLFNFIWFSFLFFLFLKIKLFFISNRNKFLCFASKQKEFQFCFTLFSLQPKSNGAPYYCPKSLPKFISKI